MLWLTARGQVDEASVVLSAIYLLLGLLGLRHLSGSCLEAAKSARVKGGLLLWLHTTGVELGLLLHPSEHVSGLGLGGCATELTEAAVVGGLLGWRLSTSVKCCLPLVLLLLRLLTKHCRLRSTEVLLLLLHRAVEKLRLEPATCAWGWLLDSEWIALSWCT